MSYNTKHFAKIYTLSGETVTVNLKKLNWTGSSSEIIYHAPNPLTLSYQNDGDKENDSIVNGSSVQFDFYSTKADANKYDELAESNVRDWQLEINKRTAFSSYTVSGTTLSTSLSEIGGFKPWTVAGAHRTNLLDYPVKEIDLQGSLAASSASTWRVTYTAPDYSPDVTDLVDNDSFTGHYVLTTGSTISASALNLAGGTYTHRGSVIFQKNGGFAGGASFIGGDTVAPITHNYTGLVLGDVLNCNIVYLAENYFTGTGEVYFYGTQTENTYFSTGAFDWSLNPIPPSTAIGSTCYPPTSTIDVTGLGFTISGEDNLHVEVGFGGFKLRDTTDSIDYVPTISNNDTSFVTLNFNIPTTYGHNFVLSGTAYVSAS